MGFEQRSIEYLKSKMLDGTFDLAQIIGIYDDISKAEFRGTINGVMHFYYLVEEYIPAVLENDIEITPEKYNHSWVLIKNKGDAGIPPEDNRILDSLYVIAQDLPKTYSENFKNQKTQKIIEIWKEAIKNDLFEVPSDIKDGIDLVNSSDLELTPEQIVSKYVVLNWIYKLNARNKIESLVGDSNDLIADLSKRISMLERLVMRLSHQILTGISMPQPYIEAYTAFVTNYLAAVDSGYFKDRTDLEDPTELFTRLMERFNLITDIIKTEYFDLKK